MENVTRYNKLVVNLLLNKLIQHIIITLFWDDRVYPNGSD